MNQTALRYATIIPGDRVLEIGFGGGDLLAELLEKHEPSFVAGVDLSRDMVKLATRRLRPFILSKKLQLWEGNIENLPNADDDFDKVYSINTVYFWKDPERALAECRRVLKDGGLLVLCFDAKEDLKLWPGHHFGFRLFEPEELQSLLQKAGFQVIDIALETKGEPGRFFCMRALKTNMSLRLAGAYPCSN